EQRDVQVLRDETVADALDAVWPPGPPREKRALLWLRRVELHAGIALAQTAPHTAQGSSTALRGHEGPYDASGLVPDLGAGGAVVGVDVVGIAELPGHPVAIGVSRADRLELLQRQIHVALTPRGEDQLGAVRAHDLLALLAHAFRHHHRARI